MLKRNEKGIAVTISALSSQLFENIIKWGQTMTETMESVRLAVLWSESYTSWITLRPKDCRTYCVRLRCQILKIGARNLENILKIFSYFKRMIIAISNAIQDQITVQYSW